MVDAYTPRLAHLGVSCFDIEKMIEFYTTVFNLQLTDRGGFHVSVSARVHECAAGPAPPARAGAEPAC